MDGKATICRLQCVNERPASSSLVLPFCSVLPSSPAMGDNVHLEASPKVEAGYQVLLAELWRHYPLPILRPLPFAHPVGSSWVWRTGLRLPQVGILKSNVSFEQEPGLGALQAVALSQGPDGTCFSVHSMV